MNRYIKDGIKILLMSLPYCITGLSLVLGEMINKTVINTMGITIIAAFGIYTSLTTVWSLVQILVGSNAGVLIANIKDKDTKERNEVGDIVTTSIVCNLAISLLVALFLLIFHNTIAKVFTQDIEVQNLLGSLLLIRCFKLPADSICDVLNNFLNATRRNKHLLILYLTYCVLLIIGNVVALKLHCGGKGVLIVTTIAVWIYIILNYVSLVKYAGLRLGKFRKEIAIELKRRVADTVTDQIIQQTTYLAQTKIASSILNTQMYAMFVVAETIVLIYEKVHTGVCEGWCVYVCEWLSGAKEQINSIYNSKEKSLNRQLKWYAVIASTFQSLLFIVTIYGIWYLFGRAFNWNEIWIIIVAFFLQNIPGTFFRVYYNTLKAKGVTKPLRYSSLIGGLLVRVPLDILCVYVLGLSATLIPLINIIDYIIRSLYVRRKTIEILTE
jgi:Na+-driven multidrug efflux pump